jgi:hypothetical protein
MPGHGPAEFGPQIRADGPVGPRQLPEAWAYSEVLKPVGTEGEPFQFGRATAESNVIPRYLIIAT